MTQLIRRSVGVTTALLAATLALPEAQAQVSVATTNHVVIIDQSGSMFGPNIDLAKRSAKIYRNTIVSSNVPTSGVDLLGLAAYSTTSTQVYPLTALPAPGYDPAADSLVASGSTSIGAGLQEALNMLSAANPTPGPRECVLLLSDGQHNTPPDPASTQAGYMSRVDKVHTIALGAGADEALMSDIAATFGKTPGLYLRADSDTALTQLETIGAFSRMALDCRDGGMIHDSITQIPPGTMACTESYVSAAQTVDFTMLFVGGAAPDTYLETPDLHPTPMITESPASYQSSGSNLTFFSAENFKRFSLNQTQAYEEGFWRYCAVNNGTTPIYLYSAISTLADRISLDVTANDLSVGSQPLVLEAKLRHLGNPIGPIRAATVNGTITRPSGATAAITFKDDGSAASGDRVANDGTYTAKVTQFPEMGSHEVLVVAEFPGNTSIPKFRRQHRLGFYKDATPPCVDLGGMSQPAIHTVNGSACFRIDRASLPTTWTPSQIVLQMSPSDGTPLNGVSVSINGGTARTAPANSWAAQFGIPWPGRTNDILYTINTSGSRRLQLQWHP